MITLYLSRGSKTKNAFETAVPSDLLPHIKQATVLRRKVSAPVHVAISPPGKGTPPLLHERFARNFAAVLVCLPEAGEWLAQRLREAIETGEDLVLADATLATSKQVVE